MEIIRHSYNTPNISKAERAASVIAGSLLIFYGIRRKTWVGAGMALAGVDFLRRGISGFSYLYQAFGLRTASEEEGRNIALPYELGVRVDESITINKPREEVYRFWRNLENLARFLEHVESVRGVEGNRSHWVVKGPGGKRIEWDAEIINEIKNELIGWRSLPGSEVANAGSVRFADASGHRGTEVRVSLQYNPPGGAVSAFVAKLFGEEPSAQIRKDLKGLKMILETGEIPVTEGQPAGAQRSLEDRDEQRKTEKVAHASEESFPASDAPAYTH
jgi:uncharacterized membrane protein